MEMEKSVFSPKNVAIQTAAHHLSEFRLKIKKVKLVFKTTC